MKAITTTTGLFLLLFFSSPVFAQDDAPIENISFKCLLLTTTTQDNIKTIQPIEGGVVTLYDPSFNEIKKVHTNESGGFVLDLLSDKQYFLVVEKQGYVPKKFAITTAEEFTTSMDQMSIQLNVASQFDLASADYLHSSISKQQQLNKEKAKAVFSNQY